MNGFAVGDLVVGHTSISLEAGVLGPKQGTTLLLGLLNVLNESHWIPPQCPSPRCLAGIDLQPFRVQRLHPQITRRKPETVVNVTKAVTYRHKKKGLSPQVEYLYLPRSAIEDVGAETEYTPVKKYISPDATYETRKYADRVKHQKSKDNLHDSKLHMLVDSYSSLLALIELGL